MEDNKSEIRNLFWTDETPPQQQPTRNDIVIQIRNALDAAVARGSNLKQAMQEVAPLFPDVVFKYKNDDIQWIMPPRRRVPPTPTNVTPLFPKR
jgi:hypothetical protein